LLPERGAFAKGPSRLVGQRYQGPRVLTVVVEVQPDEVALLETFRERPLAFERCSRTGNRDGLLPLQRAVEQDGHVRLTRRGRREIEMEPLGGNRRAHR